jgi:hypothetical protein
MKKILLSISFLSGMLAFAQAQQINNSSTQTEQERTNKQLQLEKSRTTQPAKVNIEQLKNSPGVVHIHQRRLDAMTEEDKKYILEHPEKFVIVK